MPTNELNRLYIPLFPGGEYLHKLEDYFIKNNYSVKYIQHENINTRWETRNIDEKKVIEEHHNHSPESPLEYYLDKYEIRSPKKFIFPEMVLRGSYNQFPLDRNKKVNYSPYIKKLHKYLSFFDSLFDSGRGGIPVQYQGGTILRRSLRTISNYYGFTNAWIGFSPIPNQVAIYDSEHVNWEFNNNSTDASKDVANKFLDDYLNNRISFSTYNGAPDPNLFDDLLQKGHRLLQQDAKQLLMSHVNSKRKNMLQKLKAIVNSQLYLTKKGSNSVIDKKNYVYFPIQYFRESRTTIRGDYYYDYRWIIEYISRNLPHNYDLVVKNHPNHLGEMRRDVIKNMANYAHLIHPSIDTKRAVEGSSGVITINNTVGFESLLLGKPVITLGDSFYDNFRSVNAIRNISSINDQIFDLVCDNGMNKKQIIEMISIIVSSGYTGVWGDTSEENLEDLATSILDYIES